MKESRKKLALKVISALIKAIYEILIGVLLIIISKHI